MSSIATPALLNPTDASAAADFSAAAAAMPPPFDPSEEYRMLLETTRKDGRRGGRSKVDASGRQQDAYQYLMSRERRVLDTVDRVVNDSIRNKEEGSTLLGLPIHELAMRTAGALRALLDDLIACRSLSDVKEALYDPARLPFLGVALVSLAVFVGMLSHF